MDGHESHGRTCMRAVYCNGTHVQTPERSAGNAYRIRVTADGRVTRRA